MQIDSLRINRAIIAISVQGLLLYSGLGNAAEWSIEPSVSIREEFNDNVRFTASPHTDVWMTRVSPKVEASSKTEVSEISASAQVNVNNYSSESSLNRNDQFFTLLGRTRSELNTWAMNVSYISASVAETERLATGVVIEDRPQRNSLTLNPSWTRTLSERSQFRLAYSYRDVSYDKHVTLNDYVNQGLDGAWLYQLSDQDQVNVSANYSDVNYAESLYQFSIPGGGIYTTDRRIKTLGFQFGLSRNFSEDVVGTFSIGQRSTDTTVSHTCNGELGTIFASTAIQSCSGNSADPLVSFSNSNRGTGTSFNASIDKRFSTGKLMGTLSRSTNPSGVGLVETDRVGMSISNRFTENLSGNFDVSAYNTRFVGIVGPSRKYFTYEPRLSWRYSEWTTFDAGYRYARYEVENSSAIRTANAVYLNLTYNWEKMAVSR